MPTSIVEIILDTAGGRVDLVLSALRDDNAGPDLAVVDHGATVAVRTVHSLHVASGTLRWHTAGACGLTELLALVLASTGALTVTPDRLRWTTAMP